MRFGSCAVGSIGINLAIWNARGSGGVFLPAGGYSINVAQAPIIMMKGMSSSIRGAGMCKMLTSTTFCVCIGRA